MRSLRAWCSPLELVACERVNGGLVFHVRLIWWHPVAVWWFACWFLRYALARLGW